MKMPKLNLSWNSYTDSDFETKAEHILASMTGNANFSDPVPTLVQLQEAITAYSTALIAAADLGRTNVANKNKARKDLEAVLTQLGMYVMFIANGDEAVLVSSGFTLAKDPQRLPLGKVGNVTLSSGSTGGALQSVISGVQSAKKYLHEITAEPPGENTTWKSYPGKTKFVFTDLLPGKQYWVRVVALGSGVQVNYSPVATQFAQ